MPTDPYIIDIDPSGVVSVDGIPTGGRLTRNEERYLRAVFSHRSVASKEYLVSVIYGGRDEPESKIADTIVCHIRRKLGAHRDAIVTVWARGYARNPQYDLAARTDAVIGVHADAPLLEELVHITGEEPDALMNRLLKQERDRLWADAA